MARIFSISFNHFGNSYNAIVSVKENPFYTEYNVNLLDEELSGFLTSSKIISSAPGQFSFFNVGRENYTPLMKEVLHAVSEHINMLQVLNHQL